MCVCVPNRQTGRCFGQQAYYMRLSSLGQKFLSMFLIITSSTQARDFFFEKRNTHQIRYHGELQKRWLQKLVHVILVSEEQSLEFFSFTNIISRCIDWLAF